MGEFGWAYLSGAVTGQGPAGSIQFLQDADGQLTGSNYFSFNNSDNNLFLTGSMVISGTIQANTFDVIQTNIIEISQEGSTKFGDDPTDTHVLTGSFQVVSGGMRNHYYTLTSATHTVGLRLAPRLTKLSSRHQLIPSIQLTTQQLIVLRVIVPP